MATLLFSLIPVMAAETLLELHVSINGNDSNPGTVDKPLATLDGARIAASKKAGQLPITIKFHKGTYKFSYRVSFGISDSGTAAAPITYEAAAGEKVVFSAAQTLDTSKFTKVTDDKIIARLPEKAKDKIRQLDLKAQGITQIAPFEPSTSNEPKNGEYTAFYLDGKEQLLSQWPNGDANYSLWKKVVAVGGTGGTSGGVIEYAENNPSRWTGATDLYLAGYPGHDYRYERILVAGVDPDKKTLTMKTGSDFGFVNPETNRWKIFNLLEEIDMPGEWFVDRSTMMLYYYPSSDISKANFEISNFKDHFINMQETKFVTIRGIEFTKTRGNAILMNKNIKNVTIENCIFSDIGLKTIKFTGMTRGPLMPYWTNIIDAAENCVVRDNTFQFLGSGVLDIWGGNRDTLVSGNNIISNNHIFMAGMSTKNTPLFNIFGVGNIVENNEIHNSPFHTINFYGNDHIIRYNEIFNVCREAYDAGTVYSGRDLTFRGNELSYNFIHDFLSRDPLIGYDAVGLYLDDQMSGISVHHNIIVGGSAGIQNGGGDYNAITNNTVINVKGNVLNSDNRGATWPNDGNLEKLLAKAVAIPVYAERFPEMLAEMPEPYQPYGNIISNNLSDKPLTVDANMASRGTVSNNVTVTDMSVFVNPEANDYRVKSSSEIAKKVPGILTDAFDMNKIGIQPSKYVKVNAKPNEASSPFAQLYPQNDSINLNPADLEFAWENALFADKYRVQVATDSEMKNIVFDKETYFNHIKVTGLQDGERVYYWTVNAVNISAKNATTWKTSATPYKFTTLQIGDIDQTALERAIKMAESAPDSQLREGTKQSLAATIAAAKKVNALTKGQVSQSEIDSILTKLTQEYYACLNIGYVGIDDMLKSTDDWNAVDKDLVKLGNGEIKFESSETEWEGIFNTIPSSSQILIFKAKIDFPNPSNWVGLTLKQADKDKFCYGTTSYFVAIKPNIIELQRRPAHSPILMEVPNDFLRSGEWHDIQWGAVNRINGVNIILKIDGKTVFNYLDKEGSIKEDGYFGVHLTSGHSIALKKSDTIPTASTDSIKREIPPNPEKINRVMVNGVILDTADFPPQNIENRILVPIRAIFEALGATVEWDNDARTATGKLGINTVTVTIDSKDAMANGKSITLDVPAKIINGRTMVPVRFVSESLGAEVDWNDELTTAIVELVTY